MCIRDSLLAFAPRTGKSVARESKQKSRRGRRERERGGEERGSVKGGEEAEDRAGRREAMRAAAKQALSLPRRSCSGFGESGRNRGKGPRVCYSTGAMTRDNNRWRMYPPLEQSAAREIEEVGVCTYHPSWKRIVTGNMTSSGVG
eukprot:617636-Hanusia_phi.AAC.2